MISTALGCTHVYPSGWAVVIEPANGRPRVVDHVEEIGSLRNAIANRLTTSMSADQVLCVIRLAKQYFGGDTIPGNLSSKYLTDSARTFLVDSLNFAVTGHRTISVATMSNVIDYHEIGDKVNVPAGRLDLSDLHPEVENTKTIEELLLRWSKQPNGIFDIICTLNLIL